MQQCKVGELGENKKRQEEKEERKRMRAYIGAQRDLKSFIENMSRVFYAR
jgi:hypothetical protein